MEQQWNMEGGGTLELRRDGAWAWLDARRAMDRKGLYKVWLRGGPGGRMLLGTLVPEKEGLRLTRRLLVSELERSGCWPLEGAQAVRAYSFDERAGWQREMDPARWIADPLLRSRLNGTFLSRETGEGRQLAVPFSCGAPIPLEPLFCFARLECIGGRQHLVWSFDRSGAPLPPCGPGEKGESQGGHRAR